MAEAEDAPTKVDDLDRYMCGRRSEPATSCSSAQRPAGTFLMIFGLVFPSDARSMAPGANPLRIVSSEV